MKRFNAAAGVLHLVQGVIMLILGGLLKWERGIYTFYPKLTIVVGPPFRIDIIPYPQILVTIGYARVCHSGKGNSPSPIPPFLDTMKKYWGDIDRMA